MPIELLPKRSHNSKHFDNGDGTFQLEAHVGHIHYFDKLAVSNDNRVFKDIAFTLSKGDGWDFTTHSFNPHVPNFADDWLIFRDLFQGKDREVRYKATCKHVPGRLVAPEEVGIQHLTVQNAVIYDDAFGPGMDYIIFFTRSGLVKTARIRDGFKPSADVTFEWQMDFGTDGLFSRTGSAVTRGGLLSAQSYNIGEAGHNTFLRPFMMWDSVKRVPVPTRISFSAGKKYIRKTVPASFLASSIGDVFTDTTTSYYAGAGDGYVGHNDESTWAATIGASAGTYFAYTTTEDNCFQSYHTALYYLMRMYYPADTSGIGAGQDVTAGTFNFWVTKDRDADACSLVTHATYQASTSSLANSDYSLVGSVDFGRRTVSGCTNNAMNAITLNASGLAAINTTGWTKIGIRNSTDFDNSAPTGLNWTLSRFSEYTGTSSDPYYSITYTAATPSSTIYLKGRSRNRSIFSGVSLG